jgi:hypothetical protein
MDVKYQETGHEWDEKRKKDFNARTRRMEKALLSIEKDLINFKTKPTIGYLAKLSKCAKGALLDRAKKDAHINQVKEQDDLGNILRDDGGNVILEKFGWPVSELKRIQKAWRLIKHNKTETNQNEVGSDSAIETSRQKKLIEIEELKGRVKRYMGENSMLKYALEEEQEKNRTLTKSVEQMNLSREVLEDENIRIKKELLQLRSTKKPNPLKVVK